MADPMANPDDEDNEDDSAVGVELGVDGTTIL